MANQPIVITGCQRSGTTLLNLILDSHPDVTGIDEDEFELEDLPRYLNAAEYHPAVAFKLPIQAGSVTFLAELENARLIWGLRDPRAVVASMLRLPMRLGTGRTALPWATHPIGAEAQVRIEYPRLPQSAKSELTSAMVTFERIVRVPPAQRTRNHGVFMAALCWRLKNEVIERYPETGLAYLTVRYERLVAEPRPEIERILSHLGLAWHDDVLRHHELHSGRSIGNTDNSRAIDAESADLWKSELTSHQVGVVLDLCGGRARALGALVDA